MNQSFPKKFKFTTDSNIQQEEDEKIAVKLTMKPEDFNKMSSNLMNHSNQETADKTSTSSIITQAFLSEQLLSNPEQRRKSQMLKYLSDQKLKSSDEEIRSEKSKESSQSSSEKEPQAKDFNEQTISKESQLSKDTQSIIVNLKMKKSLQTLKDSAPASESLNEGTNNTEVKVSAETANILKTLQTKNSPTKYLTVAPKPTTQGTSSVDIMTAPSIREKYSELLSSKREFILPAQYKRLMDIFKNLDLTLNYYVLHREPSFFVNLLKSVEDTLRV